MKEQTDSHSHPSTDHHDVRSDQSEHRPSKGNKTRQIQKDKVHSQEQLSEKQRQRMTREERAKVQKQKNRQAAQRSRDMHKEYVSNLERDLNNVREELTNARRYCFRCRESLQSDEMEIQVQPDLSLQQDSQELSLQGLMPGSQEGSQEVNEPESFLRILEPHEENSILKLMLFVCMVIIGVMVGFNNRTPAVEQPRTLVDMYSDTASGSLKQDAVDINSVQKWSGEKGLVQLSRGLDDPVCLDSLMRIESPAIKKSLRYIHDNRNEKEDTIMLCSLRVPKAYEIAAELTETPLVKLFVLGSQIKELVERTGSWMSLRERNIQLNGIYRLSAEIKSAEMVSHHNCLL